MFLLDTWLLTRFFIILSKYLNTIYPHYHINSNTVCPSECSCRMITSSFFFIITSIHAFCHQLYDISFTTFICWVNSINYWRFPTFGARRYTDLCSSIFGICYAYHCSTEIENGFDFFATGCALIIWWYVCALFLGRILQYYYYASICHMNVHTTAMLYNTWLVYNLTNVRKQANNKNVCENL
jgi:hypothetical protein